MTRFDLLSAAISGFTLSVILAFWLHPLFLPLGILLTILFIAMSNQDMRP